LFYQTKVVFLLNKKGYSVAVNLKIDNFFEQIDDYVITASLSKIKESSNLLLFDGRGKIIGIN
jgi:hypothetical protein